MIFGYKGDVEVLTLRKTRVTKERVKESTEEVDVYNWEVVPVRLDQIKEDEYVLLYCMMNNSAMFKKGVESVYYKGAMENIVFEDGHIFSVCEDAKNLAFTLPYQTNTPLVDEKTFAEWTDEDCFGRRSGMSYRSPDKEIERGEVEEYVKYYNDNPGYMNIGAGVLKIKERGLSLYEGTLYNIKASPEYALITKEGLFLKTEH